MKIKKIVSLALAAAMGFAIVSSTAGYSAWADEDATTTESSSAVDDEIIEPQDDWVKMDLIFATYLTETNPMQANIVSLQNHLDELMPGYITIETYANNTLLKGADIFDGIINGTCDIGVVQPDYTPARFPLSAIFSYPGIVYNSAEVVKGFVKTRTKGGMIVDVFGIEAFLPGSQIDIKPIRDYDQFVGQNMDLKVVKINQEFRNVVVSHKALLEAEIEAKRSEIISRLEKGQILEGEVKNITNYGVFVDLGGVDGLIHITDLSWGRINHPEEVVNIGDKIKVVVLDFNPDQKRIALGLKQLTPHPWDSLDPNLKVGDKVKGKVVLIADYGAFVEIQPGVEGLIHVSEMSWSPRLHSAQEFLKVGDEVEAQVLSLEREGRKMSLGLKQLTANPWDSIREKYPVGSTHKAIVRNITNFGVFAELEDGVEGLVHISDLSWSKIKHPSEIINAGDTIDVVILDFDEQNHKLSLGHKQLLPNPWDEIEAKFPVGSVVEGTVKSVNDKDATILLEGDVEAFALIRDLVKEDGKNAVVGETLPFKVSELRRSTRKVRVSHTRTYSEAKEARVATETANTQKAVKKINSSVEKTTLGDISELAALKEKLEKGN